MNNRYYSKTEVFLNQEISKMENEKREVSKAMRFEDYKAEDIIRMCYSRKWGTPELVEDEKYIYWNEVR
jgi:hypothetical protein